MTAGRAPWIIAFALALALHGLVAAAFWQGREPGVAKAPGVGGIEIALGQAGGAPGGAARASRPAPEPEAPEPEASEPHPDPVELQPEETPPDDAPPQPQAPPDPPPQPPEPANARADSVPVTAITPPAVSSPPPEASPAPSLAGAGGQAGAEALPETGDRGPDITAGGRAGARADYAAVLLAWLEPHREYPRAARARRQQGVVRLYIHIARNGAVLEARIETSSGHPRLDRAALDMVERAQPLPAIPEDIPANNLEIIIPAHFHLSR